MRRIGLAVVRTISLSAAPLAAQAEPAGKDYLGAHAREGAR